MTKPNQKKAQLHQLLAVVDSDLRGSSEAILTESRKVFGKESNFSGATRRLEMFDVDLEHENVSESNEVVTTVPDRLQYTLKATGRYWDGLLQKEATNQLATANVIVGDETIIENAPAQWLLRMEKELKAVRGLAVTIPTHDANVAWVDSTKGKHILQTAEPSVTFKTEKVQTFVEASPATKEHPAQVAQVNKNINVGKWTKTLFSGAISSAEKASLIGRLDQLVVAFKKARARANQQEIQKITAAKQLQAFILGDLV